MSEEMETLDNNEISTTINRPQFLTVLCILSWIMGGLVIVISLIMVLIKNKFADLITEMNSEQRKQMQLFYENYDFFTYSNIIYYLLSIFAVILMYRLNKTGFYLYIVTHILINFSQYIFTPFVIDGSFIFSMIILLGFFGMYGANLKYMK